MKHYWNTKMSEYSGRDAQRIYLHIVYFVCTKGKYYPGKYYVYFINACDVPLNIHRHRRARVILAAAGCAAIEIMMMQ